MPPTSSTPISPRLVTQASVVSLDEHHVKRSNELIAPPTLSIRSMRYSASMEGDQGKVQKRVRSRSVSRPCNNRQARSQAPGPGQRTSVWTRPPLPPRAPQLHNTGMSDLQILLRENMELNFDIRILRDQVDKLRKVEDRLHKLASLAIRFAQHGGQKEALDQDVADLIVPSEPFGPAVQEFIRQVRRLERGTIPKL